MILFSLVIVVVAYLSALTTIPGSPVSILSLVPALVLIGLMTRGTSIVLPAILGQATYCYFNGDGLVVLAGTLLSITAGPLLAHQALRRINANPRERSHLVQCFRLFGVGALVLAPVSALVLTASLHLSDQNGFSLAQYLVWQWAAIATSAIIFCRGIMSWMPADGSGFCPVKSAGQAQAEKRQSANLLPLFGIALLATGALLLGANGDGFIERTIVIPIFGISCACAVLQNRFHAGNAIMLAGLLNSLLRLEGHKIGTVYSSADALPLIGEYLALLMVGSTIAHLLSALTEERKAQAERLQHQARTNVLTNLPNLRALMHHLQAPAKRSSTKANKQLIAEISFPDIHQWADLASRTDATQVEKKISVQLKHSLADCLDELFHLDTGRFVLAFRQNPDIANVVRQISKVFENNTFRIGKHRLRLAYSVGMVDLPNGRQEPEMVLASLAIAQRRAAMSNSKFCRLDHDPARVNDFRKDMQWTEKVRSYLDNKAIRLFAQPIESGKGPRSFAHGLHFEVLARIETQSGKILTPDRFLPAIEKNGLSLRFDRLIIEKTLSTLEENTALRKMTRMCSINVTGPSICDAAFADFLTKAIAKHNIDPGTVCVEITESDSISNLKAALHNIGKIRARGVRVAVDDFGTGMATFDYIRKLRPDLVKIDGAFVRRYEHDALDREIVQSITRLARSINAKTVAEYVENESIAARMTSIGVDFLQGWGISKPMPIAELTAYANQRARMAKQSDRPPARIGNFPTPESNASLAD